MPGRGKGEAAFSCLRHHLCCFFFFFFLPLAKGSSLVLGAGHLEGLRLFGAKVQVGSIFRAPGQSSWGGRAGRWEVPHCPLWAVVVRAGSCLALG